MGARRASATAVAAVLGAVLLITLLGVWAASIGPGEVFRGDGPEPVRVHTETPSESPTDEAEPIVIQGEPAHSDVLQGVAIGFVLMLVLVLLFGVYQLGRWGLGTWQARDRPDPREEDVEFDVLDLGEPLARALGDGAAAQRDALESGTPRNAIVEMWNRFEVQAETAGAWRRPWETSSEFTIRVLEAVDADSHAVARLAGLYREARFSEHELTEDDRHAAREALAAIHVGLTRPSQVEQP